jgi:hypothetical protein
MACWICQEDVVLNADTCWPVETGNVTINAATHSRCMMNLMGRIHGDNNNGHGTPVRGPGGNNVIGYVRGPHP